MRRFVILLALAAGTLVQLTDVSARRTDQRPTDSQRMVRAEELQLLDWVEQEAERRKRREARDRASALPKFELAERQAVVDAAVSADEEHGFVEETSWADEYKRILKLFENTLKGNGNVRRTD